MIDKSFFKFILQKLQTHIIEKLLVLEVYKYIDLMTGKLIILVQFFFVWIWAPVFKEVPEPIPFPVLQVLSFLRQYQLFL